MSEATLIKATDPKSELSAEFAFDFGEAEDLIGNFGADVVLKSFVGAQKVIAQNRMRELLKAGKSSEDVAAFMSAEWKPGIETRDPTVSLVNKIKAMNEDERVKYVADLMAALSAAGVQQ